MIQINQLKSTRKQLLANAGFITQIQGNDFFMQEQNTGGQQNLIISVSQIDNNKESWLQLNDEFKPSFIAEYSYSQNQRLRGVAGYLEAIALGESEESDFMEHTITALSYTNNTTLSVTLATEFDGTLGMYVDITGLTDVTFNFANLIVGSISQDKKTLSFTYSDDTTIVSQSNRYLTPSSPRTGTVAGGKLKAQKLASRNFAQQRFARGNNDWVTCIARFDGGKIKVGGALGANQYVGNKNVTPTYGEVTSGESNIKPYARLRLHLNEDTIRFQSSVADGTSGDQNACTFSEVKPSYFSSYINRMRLSTSKSAVEVVAKIKSIVKNGSNTMTITTMEPHGLTSGYDGYGLYGVRNTSNFPNGIIYGNTINVTSPTTFTVACGTSATDTQYGGVITKGNGCVDISNASASINSASRDSSGKVTLIGNGNWANIVIGEYVDVVGCVDASGNYVGVDGAYRVYDFSGTTLVLEPIKELDGSFVKNGNKQQLSPTGDVINTTNCGGIVLLRQTARLHDISCTSYIPQMVRFEGQGVTNDSSLAIPVIFPVTQSVALVHSFNTSTGGAGAGGAIINPTNGTYLVSSSAAKTATTTDLIQNTFGNAFQISVPITAVSGTNPTLDMSLEESFDNVNWNKVYDFERITATGVYDTPTLKSNAMYLRLVQTIGGTSPSFTRSIQKTNQPFQVAKDLKRMIDRTISLVTASSTTPVLKVDNMKNIQLVLNAGTSTTAPTLQLEGSEDNINWYSIDTVLSGTTTAGTVQKTVINFQTKFVRAKVVTPGVATVAGYVAIKAWN